MPFSASNDMSSITVKSIDDLIYFITYALSGCDNAGVDRPACIILPAVWAKFDIETLHDIPVYYGGKYVVFGYPGKQLVMTDKEYQIGLDP